MPSTIVRSVRLRTSHCRRGSDADDLGEADNNRDMFVVERTVHYGQIELLKLIDVIRRYCVLKDDQEDKRREVASYGIKAVRRSGLQVDVIGSARYHGQRVLVEAITLWPSCLLCLAAFTLLILIFPISHYLQSTIS